MLTQLEKNNTENKQQHKKKKNSFFLNLMKRSEIMDQIETL